MVLNYSNAFKTIRHLVAISSTSKIINLIKMSKSFLYCLLLLFLYIIYTYLRIIVYPLGRLTPRDITLLALHRDSG